MPTPFIEYEHARRTTRASAIRSCWLFDLAAHWLVYMEPDPEWSLFALNFKPQSVAKSVVSSPSRPSMSS